MSVFIFRRLLTIYFLKIVDEVVIYDCEIIPMLHFNHLNKSKDKKQKRKDKKQVLHGFMHTQYKRKIRNRSSKLGRHYIILSAIQRALKLLLRPEHCLQLN